MFFGDCLDSSGGTLQRGQRDAGDLQGSQERGRPLVEGFVSCLCGDVYLVPLPLPLSPSLSLSLSIYVCTYMLLVLEIRRTLALLTLWFRHRLGASHYGFGATCCPFQETERIDL